jgi:hypothetical protein
MGSRQPADDLRQRAAECQQMAEHASTRETRDLFIELAQQWRDIAKQVEHLSRTRPRGHSFLYLCDKSSALK